MICGRSSERRGLRRAFFPVSRRSRSSRPGGWRQRWLSSTGLTCSSATCWATRRSADGADTGNCAVQLWEKGDRLWAGDGESIYAPKGFIQALYSTAGDPNCENEGTWSEQRAEYPVAPEEGQVTRSNTPIRSTTPRTG